MWEILKVVGLCSAYAYVASYQHWKVSWDAYSDAEMAGAFTGMFWPISLPILALAWAARLTTPTVGAARRVKLEKEMREKERRIRDLEDQLGV